MSSYHWSSKNANGTAMGRYLTEVESRFLLSTCGARGWPARVLDVGGGDGRFARLLAARGSTVLVLERDSLPLRELTASGWNAPVVMADGVKLPFQPSSFDVVLAMEVAQVTDVNHLPHFLQETRRVLGDGGVLIFTSENPRSWGGVMARVRPSYYGYDGYRYYSTSIGDVQRELAVNGFEAIEVRGFRWPPFSRESKSPWISRAAIMERLLGLHRLPGFSPWVYWVAQRRHGASLPNRRSA